jgi:hypothetical protein
MARNSVQRLVTTLSEKSQCLALGRMAFSTSNRFKHHDEKDLKRHLVGGDGAVITSIISPSINQLNAGVYLY